MDDLKEALHPDGGEQGEEFTAVQPNQQERPFWSCHPDDRRESYLAQLDLCDAIVRNNIPVAMAALGIAKWNSEDGVCVFDSDPRKRGLVNPNLIDLEAPNAWSFFRRNMRSSSLLHEAASYSSKMFGNGDDPTITRMLLACGAKISYCDDSGYTPLHAAAYANNVVVSSVLLAHGAEIDPKSVRGLTPLHTAAFHNCTETCDFLLIAGADPMQRNRNGLTPMAYARSLPASQQAMRVLHAAYLKMLMQQVIDGTFKKGEIGQDGSVEGTRPNHFLPARGRN
jgi:hypothetical protein